jgi:DNA-binding MarR family transcriptional regulator
MSPRRHRLAFRLSKNPLTRPLSLEPGLQRHILRCLLTQAQRTPEVLGMEHRALVQTLRQDKSNISHSLGTLAARGLIVMRRTPGGKADALALTAEGRTVALAIASSCA